MLMDIYTRVKISFYIYLGISVILFILTMLFKLPTKLVSRAFNIIGALWVFGACSWGLNVSIWISILIAFVAWYITPGYTNFLISLGETTGKMVFKNTTEDKEKQEK